MISIAKWVSILAHPFVMVAIVVGVAGSHFASNTEVLYPVLMVLVSVLTCTSLCILGSIIGYILLVVIPMLAWSRITLARHRPHELILGLTLGVLSGVALAYA